MRTRPSGSGTISALESSAIFGNLACEKASKCSYPMIKVLLHKVCEPHLFPRHPFLQMLFGEV